MSPFWQLTMKVLSTDRQSYQRPEVYIWVMDQVIKQLSEWVSKWVSEIAIPSDNLFITLRVFTG